MITFLNLLIKCVESINQIFGWTVSLISRFDMNYAVVVVVIILFWKMLDLFLYGEEF